MFAVRGHRLDLHCLLHRDRRQRRDRPDPLCRTQHRSRDGNHRGRNGRVGLVDVDVPRGRRQRNRAGVNDGLRREHRLLVRRDRHQTHHSDDGRRYLLHVDEADRTGLLPTCLEADWTTNHGRREATLAGDRLLDAADKGLLRHAADRIGPNPVCRTGADSDRRGRHVIPLETGCTAGRTARIGRADRRPGRGAARRVAARFRRPGLRDIRAGPWHGQQLAIFHGDGSAPVRFKHHRQQNIRWAAMTIERAAADRARREARGQPIDGSCGSGAASAFTDGLAACLGLRDLATSRHDRAHAGAVPGQLDGENNFVHLPRPARNATGRVHLRGITHHLEGVRNLLHGLRGRALNGVVLGNHPLLAAAHRLQRIVQQSEFLTRTSKRGAAGSRAAWGGLGSRRRFGSRANLRRRGSAARMARFVLLKCGEPASHAMRRARARRQRHCGDGEPLPLGHTTNLLEFRCGSDTGRELTKARPSCQPEYRRSNSAGCTALRPVKCSICRRQEKPGATRSVVSSAWRMAGNRRCSPTRREIS